MRYFILFTLISLAVGAGAAENYETARDSVPSRWTYSSDYVQPLPVDDAWWRTFDDPVLDSLISLAIDNNFDVAMAFHRMEVARQAIRSAKSGYYPQLSVSAGYTASRTSGNMSSVSTPAMRSNYFSAGVSMAWEADVFGRVTSRVKESKARYEASRADYGAAMVSLCAEVASQYIQLRTWQVELQVARDHLESQGKVLKIAEARHEAGLNSSLDVAQASTIYYSTESSIPALETQITQGINAIALMCGVYPDAVDPLLGSASVVPDYRRIVAVGVPAELLRRRPDIRQAEYNMAAAAAAIGVARKDFLPVISVQGRIGYDSHNIGHLFDSRSLSYSVAPTISWTIFDGMARNAALASAREDMQVSVEQYNQTMMTAYEEVSNAMAAYTGQLHTIEYLTTVVERAQQQMDLSLDLYKQGLEGFLSVANAQVTLLEYTDQLTVARGNAAADLVNLYRALGGGWETLSE